MKKTTIKKMFRDDLKIVVYDIETSGTTVSTWSLWPNNGIPYQSIIKDWHIISISWKVIGKDKVHSVSVLNDPKRFKKDPTDDFHVIKTFLDAIQDVDVLVAYNGDNFDIKKFNSRVIAHDLPPIPRILSIDPMKELRKVAKFTSHRLDYLMKKLTGKGKMSTPSGTWVKAGAGDVKAIKDMVAYNKIDVTLLEEFYLKLKRYFVGSLNIAKVGTCNCGTCGSDKVQSRGYLVRKSGARIRRYQCMDCGSWFNDGKILNKPLSKS